MIMVWCAVWYDIYDNFTSHLGITDKTIVALIDAIQAWVKKKKPVTLPTVSKRGEGEQLFSLSTQNIGDSPNIIWF